MERIYTSEVAAHVGEQVRLAGWLHTLRRLGGINFLVLRDVRGTVQVVVDTAEALATLEGLLPETVLAVEGQVVAEPQAPGGVEIHAPAFEILSPVRDALPFPLNKPEVKAGLPVFLDHATVGLRHPAKRAPVPAIGRSHGRLSRHAERSRLHRDPNPQAGRFGHRGRRQRLCRGLLRPAARTWRKARSSTSRSWWACSSGCMR